MPDDPNTTPTSADQTAAPTTPASSAPDPAQQQSAGQAQQSVPPQAAAPTAQTPAATAPAPAAAQPPAKPAPPSPQQVQQHHDSLLGQAARFLLGTPMQYSVGPDGKTVATPQKQTPGILFRSILAGALLGGAVGSQNKTGSGLASAAQGAAAVMEKNQEQDLQRRSQAEQDFKNQQEVDAANQAKIYQAAQIAHMHVQDLINNQQLDLQNQEHIDKLNDQYQTRADAAVAAGAKPAQVMVGGKDINATPGNGKLVMDAAKQDPSILTAPQGYHRVWTQKVDYSGLHDDPAKGWVDKDGNYVDLADRTTGTFYDVPDGLAKTPIQLTGKQIEATGIVPAGTLEPKKMYTTTFSDVAGMTATGGQNLNEAAKTRLAARTLQIQAAQVANEGVKLRHEINTENWEKMKGAYDVAQARVNALNDQLKTIDFSFTGGDQMKRDLMSQLDQATNDLKDAYDRIYPSSTKKPQPTSEGGAAPQTPNFIGADGTQYSIPPGDVDGFLKTHPTAKPITAQVPQPQFNDPGGPPSQAVTVWWPTGTTSVMTRSEYNSRMASQNYQTQQQMNGAKIVGLAPAPAQPNSPNSPNITGSAASRM